jgi:short-subunit dehydrogenase
MRGAHDPSTLVFLSATVGIGKSLAKRLADQGLNVVLVALPDDTLNDTFEQLATEYPGVQFRKVRTGPTYVGAQHRRPCVLARRQQL